MSLLQYVYCISYPKCHYNKSIGGCHGHDCMVVGFTTTYAINTYHHWRCEFEPLSWRGVLDTTFCDKVCQWFSLDTVNPTTIQSWPWQPPIDLLVFNSNFSSVSAICILWCEHIFSSTYNTDCHDITEILLNI
jgi:hypothetical protein